MYVLLMKPPAVTLVLLLLFQTVHSKCEVDLEVVSCSTSLSWEEFPNLGQSKIYRLED